MANLPSGDRPRFEEEIEGPLADRRQALRLLAGGCPPVGDDDDRSPAQARLERAAGRDTAAAARDVRARARDEAAELRDRRVAAAGVGSHEEAGRDRRAAAQDREEAACERLRALVDREALAREGRDPGPLA